MRGKGGRGVKEGRGKTGKCKDEVNVKRKTEERRKMERRRGRRENRHEELRNGRKIVANCVITQVSRSVCVRRCNAHKQTYAHIHAGRANSAGNSMLLRSKLSHSIEC